MEQEDNGADSTHSIRNLVVVVNNDPVSCAENVDSLQPVREKEENERRPQNEVINDHCLICDAAVQNTTCYNVFGQLRCSHTSRTSVFEKVGDVLSRNLHSIHLHSEVVCGRCLNLLVEYEETKYKLRAIQQDLVTKFDNTATRHLSHTVRNLPGKLVITEEGKVVDSNGKEKESPIRRRKIKNKIKTNKKGVKVKPYSCSVCGKEFRAYSHRVEHMLIHLGEKPWSCKECNKTFRTKSALKVHTSKHSGHRPYTCKECGKSFMDKYYFEHHCRVHSGIRPFSCTYCQKAFARKKDLVIHVKAHTGDKPHKCGSCSKTFAVKSRLIRHIRTHSREKRSLQRGEHPFQCIHCSKAFATKTSWLVHVRLHMQHQCPQCSEKFEEQSKLEEHVAIKHNAVKPQENIPQADEPIQIQTLTPVQIETIPQVLQTLAPIQVDSLIPTDELNLQTVQTIPLSQVAQLEWSDGTPGGTSTAYVNIIPGTYVSILN